MAFATEQSVGPSPEAIADQFVSKVRNFWNAAFDSLLASSTLLTAIKVETNLATVESIITGEIGARVDATMPPEMATLIHLRTGTSGRRNRGRYFSPDAFEVDWDAQGRPTVELLARITATATAAGNYVADNIPLSATNIVNLLGVVILHGDGGPPTPVTSFQLAPNVGIMRTRRR